MENSHQTPTTLVQENNVSHSGKNPSLSLLLSGVVLVTALVAGGIGYYLGSMQKSQAVFPDQEVQVTTKPESIQVACTMEAKLCPDGSSVGRSGPNCEFAECPEPTSNDSKFILVEDIIKTDEKGNFVPGTKGNIFLTMPSTASISEKSITLNNITYEVVSNLIAGLCPMDAEKEECSYSDEKTSRGDILRIWKDNKGIFALNLIPVKINGYDLDSIVVTKKENDALKESEVVQWKEIFQTLSSEPAK